MTGEVRRIRSYSNSDSLAFFASAILPACFGDLGDCSALADLASRPRRPRQLGLGDRASLASATPPAWPRRPRQLGLGDPASWLRRSCRPAEALWQCPAPVPVRGRWRCMKACASIASGRSVSRSRWSRKGQTRARGSAMSSELTVRGRGPGRGPGARRLGWT